MLLVLLILSVSVVSELDNNLAQLDQAEDITVIVSATLSLTEFNTSVFNVKYTLWEFAAHTVSTEALEKSWVA